MISEIYQNNNGFSPLRVQTLNNNTEEISEEDFIAICNAGKFYEAAARVMIDLGDWVIVKNEVK